MWKPFYSMGTLPLLSDPVIYLLQMAKGEPQKPLTWARDDQCQTL